MAGDIYVSFGADTGGLEAAFALAKAQANAFAAEVRALATEMTKTGATADSELAAKLKEASARLAESKSHVAEFSQELRAHGTAAEGAAEGIATLREGVTKFAELAGVAFSAEAIKEWVTSTAELGEKLESVAAKLGVTKQQASELQGVAALSGTDFNALQLDMERLQVSLATVGDKSSRVAEGLRVLGVDARSLASEPVTQQMEMLAAAVSRFQDGATKTAAVGALGRSFVELLPLLDKGTSGFAELRAKLEETGAVMSDETVSSLAQVKESISALGLEVQALSTEAFGALAGSIRGCIALLTEMAADMRDSFASGGLLADAFQLLAAAIKQVEQFLGETIWILEHLDAAGQQLSDEMVAEFRGLGMVIADTFQALGKGLPNFFTALETAGSETVQSLGRQFTDLGQVIARAVTGDFAGAKAAFQAVNDDAEATGAKIRGAFSNVFDFSAAKSDAAAMLEEVRRTHTEYDRRSAEIDAHAQKLYDKIWGDNAGAPASLPSTTKPQVKPMDIGGRSGAGDALRQARVEADEEVKLAQGAADEKRKALDDELSHHLITTSQWLAASKDALNDELQDTIAAYQAELSQAGLKGSQIAAIKASEAEAIQRINTQIVDDERKAADETRKQWQSVADDIESAWNSQLRGLLAGTTSWSQAMKNIAADLIIKFIEGAEKMGLQWVVNEAVKTAATDAGAAARTAAGAGEASAGIAADAEAALKSIFTSGAETFAGVFGFLAPIMGPAAAAPAAAAQGTVLGMAGAIASADIGMWQVPGDQLAMIHRNELVMPAAQAGAFRDLLSGAASGGAAGAGVSVNPTTHFHVSALDGASVAQWARDNAGTLAKTLDQAARHGAMLGLRRFSLG